MSIRFVKTGILSSSDGLDFNVEEKVENEDLRKARLGKSLLTYSFILLLTHYYSKRRWIKEAIIRTITGAKRQKGRRI